MMLIPQTVLGGSDLTDAGKKEIVYEKYEEYKKGFPLVGDITPREAMDLMETGSVLFVDIRKYAEMNVSMLPGAVSKEEFLEKLSEPKSKAVVAYCTIGHRSGKFAMEMAKKGVRIFNLAGGLIAWVLEGGEVYDTHGETKRVHVYGKKWNYLPKGYEPVMFGFFEKYF